MHLLRFWSVLARDSHRNTTHAPPTATIFLKIPCNCDEDYLLPIIQGLGTEYFRSLLQSNYGVSVLDFVPRPEGGSPYICLNRLNQTPGSPIGGGSSAGRKASKRIVLVCHGSSQASSSDGGDVSMDMLGTIQVIADNVGDNVGDIAGMGSDLFGSYAESSCAALFVASISSFGASHDFTAMAYPLLISSMGIIVCLITTFFATDFLKINGIADIEPSLKRQLLISTILMTGGIALVSFTALPSEFTIFDFGANKLVKNWHIFFCVSIGLWAGLVIGYIAEYYTSSAYSPVRDVADSCKTGAATNVIFGLTLVYFHRSCS